MLFLDQLKTKSGRTSGFVGLITAAVALVLFGSGKMVLISMIAIMVILVMGRKVIPAVGGIISIVLIHLYKKNTTLNIFLGTAVYMLLLRLV